LCYSHFAAIILIVFTFSFGDAEADGLAEALGSAIVATTSTW
jgi:hypothetical protein